MHIVFFVHPSFLQSNSMPRYAQMLVDGMRNRNHSVAVYSPKPRLFNLSTSNFVRKWLGYIDQYILFPFEVRKRLKQQPLNTIFVFTDNALGPWVPLVANRPHIIHCHDFLAQRSALGEIPENPTSWTGQQYQAFIRRGYSKGKHFISVSQKTREDLHRFLGFTPSSSYVVYNGLNYSFSVSNLTKARLVIQKKTGIDTTLGYLLHVGGDQWYKNRQGVIDIYDAWRRLNELSLPLLLVGVSPAAFLSKRKENSPYKADIHFVIGLDNDFVRLAYAGASTLIFPSLAEGFGWPIAEAMASGCPVITTNEAPMTEVAGDAALLMNPYPKNKQEVIAWSEEGAKLINTIIKLSDPERKTFVERGLVNAERFNTESCLNQIEKIYCTVLQETEIK